MFIFCVKHRILQHSILQLTMFYSNLETQLFILGKTKKEHILGVKYFQHMMRRSLKLGFSFLEPQLSEFSLAVLNISLPNLVILTHVLRDVYCRCIQFP